MKTTGIGQLAENAVAQELRRQGHKILDQNWKTPICEIDIVTQKNSVVYFVEVKHRSQLTQGQGLEYIGPQKVKRLYFAARVWVQSHGWEGDYRILAAEVSGFNFEYLNILEIEQA